MRCFPSYFVRLVIGNVVYWTMLEQRMRLSFLVRIPIFIQQTSISSGKLAEDPSLEKKHHETCESGKNLRKKVVQNGTKKLSRFDAKHRPKWNAIIKESIIPVSERKILHARIHDSPVYF